MIIELSELIKHKSFKKDIQLTYEEDKLYYDGEEILFIKPICTEGSITGLGDIISVDLILNTELQLTCSRCLEKFNYPLEFEIHEKFSTENVEDDDVIFLENDKLDITELVENSIIMALPIKKLCKEDCKGLCQKCGTNLNIHTCDCESQDIDPRLAKLKDLFLDN